MWLIKILLMALFLVFLIQNNNDLVSVWPIPESSLMVGVKRRLSGNVLFGLFVRAYVGMVGLCAA